jgi:hypothetical protein
MTLFLTFILCFYHTLHHTSTVGTALYAGSPEAVMGVYQLLCSAMQSEEDYLILW